MTTRTVLLAVGGPMELVGLGLISLDILMPGAKGLASSGRVRKMRLVERVRRLVGHFRGDRTITSADIGTAVEHSQALPITPRGGRTEAQPLDAQVAQIRGAMEILRQRLDGVEHRLRNAEQTTAREVAKIREELLTAIAEAVRRSEGAYLPLRGVGVVLTFGGATLVFLASMTPP